MANLYQYLSAWYFTPILSLYQSRHWSLRETQRWPLTRPLLAQQDKREMKDSGGKGGANEQCHHRTATNRSVISTNRDRLQTPEGGNEIKSDGQRAPTKYDDQFDAGGNCQFWERRKRGPPDDILIGMLFGDRDAARAVPARYRYIAPPASHPSVSGSKKRKRLRAGTPREWHLLLRRRYLDNLITTAEKAAKVPR